MKNITFLFLIMGIFLFFSPGTGKLHPQETEGASDTEEAPEHLLDMNIGDVGTDVFWQGYWRYRVTYGTGWENGPDGYVFPSAFPGMQQGLEFKQEPDFFLSVFLLDRYFLETSFTEGYDKNTYVMGYVGGEDDPIKEVRIGNAGIGMGEYEGIDVSSPDYNTPGISGRFETAQSEHEFMIRYDPTEEQTKNFIGSYEVTEEEIPLTDYIEGRYIILPHTGLSGLRVYRQTDGGSLPGSDGRRYSRITSGFTVDLEKGLLTLDEAADGRVAVFYRTAGSPVGDPAAAVDFIMDTDGKGRPVPSLSLLPFSWDETNPYTSSGQTFRETSLIGIDGLETLLVHNPGEFSPFQTYNRYAFNSSLPDESWRTLITLEDRGTTPEDSTEFDFSTGSSILTVLAEGQEERAAANRVPFALGNPEIYGPGRTRDGGKLSRNLLIAVKDRADNYFLGSGLIRGSVTVRVNGVEDQTVIVDYDKGELRFTRYIFPDDRIEVTYRTEKAGLAGGDLFMAQGNRLFFSPAMRLELAESLRWTIPESQMSEEAGESPGVVDLAANWYYEEENLKLKVGTGLNLKTADTAGNLRIQGMEESGFTFSVSEDQLVPSEVSLTPDTGRYDPADRAGLIYRDFFSTNNTGQTFLNSYQWNAAVDPSQEGPSLAGAVSDDPFSSRVMVMTYDLEGNEWSAGDYLPVSEELIDLSGYAELTFYLYRQNLEGDDLKVTLLVGENGEREDYDDNGSVDSGSSSYLIEQVLTLPPQEGSWQQVSIPLSVRDRQKLSRVRSLRFVLENNTSSGASAGELLAAGFRGEGSPLVMKVLNANGTEQDGENLDAVEVDDSSLETAFPEVSDIFHPDGETQKVLKVSWGADSKDGTPLGSGESWSGTSWMEGLSPLDYGELALYLKHNQAGGTGRISLTDPEGRGIRIAYEPGSGEWEKLTVNLREGTAEFSGPSSISSLAIDKDTTEFTRFEIGLEGLSSGTLYLDEIHLADPNFTTGAMAEYTVDYTRPGEILATAGGFPLLGNFNVYNRLNYYTEGSNSYFSDRSNRVESQINSGIDLMNIRLEGDLELVYSGEEPQYSAGHLVRIPAQSRFGWVSDQYSRSFQGGTDFMSRENLIHLTPLSALTMEAGTGGDGSEGTMTQNWGGWISGRPTETTDFRVSLDFYQSADWETDSESYFNDWAADFRYIRPLEEEIENREGFGKGTFQLNREIFGVAWKPALEYSAEDSFEWTQRNTWSSELSFPLSFGSGRGGWTLEPGYSRKLENTLYPEEYDNFRDDIDTLFKGIHSQFPLWNFVPFYEIFGRDTLGPFEDTLTLTDDSRYTPEVFAGMSRMPGSRLSDFIVPSSLDIAIDREYRKKQDTLYWENHWEFQYVQSALNIFGEYGSHPVFDFYKTDEWTSSLQYILSSREEWRPKPEELIYQNYITLMGEETWEIVLDNSFSVDFDKEIRQENLQFIFRWREGANAWIKVPFFDRLIVRTNYLEHEEKLLFSGYFDENDFDNTTYDTTLTHQTKLVIDRIGSLRGWMSLGLGGKQDVFRNGYELGLELEISF